MSSNAPAPTTPAPTAAGAATAEKNDPRKALKLLEKKLGRKFSLNRPKMAYGKLQGLCQGQPFCQTISEFPVCIGRGPSLPADQSSSTMSKLDVGIVKTVSRHHVVLKWSDTDGYVLECLSRNGVIVNGKAVMDRQQAILPSNKPSPLRFGGIEVYFLPPILPDTPCRSNLQLLEAAFEGKAAEESLSIEQATEILATKYNMYLESFGGRENLKTLVT